MSQPILYIFKEGEDLVLMFDQNDLTQKDLEALIVRLEHLKKIALDKLIELGYKGGD